MAVVSQLLVLGAGFEQDGTPNHQTLGRATFAAHYQANNLVERVVFSGGYSSIAPKRNRHDLSEAEIMAELAIELGMPEDLVRMEPKSTSTYSNFANSAALLEAHTQVDVVAHNWQMSRALLIGRKALTQVVKPLIVDIDDPIDTSAQEKILFSASKLLLLGVRPGNAHAVEKRGLLLESTARVVGPAVRQIISRHHSAFK